jgi:hypothetical protein
MERTFLAVLNAFAWVMHCTSLSSPAARAICFVGERGQVTLDVSPDLLRWWPTSAGIIGGELNPNPRQVEKRSDLANQMIVWDNLLETE